MNPVAFRHRIRALRLSLGRFADLTGVSPSTAANWGKGRSGRGVQAFPLWVGLLLDAWERAGVAADSGAALPTRHCLAGAERRHAGSAGSIRHSMRRCWVVMCLGECDRLLDVGSDRSPCAAVAGDGNYRCRRPVPPGLRASRRGGRCAVRIMALRHEFERGNACRSVLT